MVCGVIGVCWYGVWGVRGCWCGVWGEWGVKGFQCDMWDYKDFFIKMKKNIYI